MEFHEPNSLRSLQGQYVESSTLTLVITVAAYAHYVESSTLTLLITVAAWALRGVVHTKVYRLGGETDSAIR